MQRAGFLAVVLLMAFFPIGCGGSSGGGSPVSPTPAATATSITLTLTAPLAVGATAQATATATMSNGTTQAITAGFKSDTPSVAMVTDSGLVTGVSSGLANIYVVFGGVQGTKNLRILPNFQGNWAGRYVVTNCSQTGAFAVLNTCAGMVGSSLPIYATLTQSGETVSGRMGLGSLNTDSFTAPIGSDGRIQFVGRVDDDPSVDCQFVLSSPAAGQLTGNLVQTWRLRDYVGTMVLTGTINTMTKSSSGTVPLSATPRVRGVATMLEALKR